MDTVTLGKRR